MCVHLTIITESGSPGSNRVGKDDDIGFGTG